MKKATYIVLIGTALVTLAAGAWIVDGVKWVGKSRRRSRLERVTGRHALDESHRRRGPTLFTHGDAQHFAVTV